jgi:mediator of RNA polymerase II transcription subunit 14
LKNLKAYLTDVNPKTSDIAMNPSGALALKLRTPFGQPFIDRVESLLQKCKQLDHYLAGSKNMGYSCTSLSLSDFAFSYGSFGARLLFSNTQPIRLKLEPANMNPHHRIRTFLQTMINNTNSQDPFFHLAMTMKVTLPWMQILDKLEAAHLSRRSLNIHVRSSTTYVLTFSSPLPACQFQVKIFAKNKDRASNKKEYWYSVRFDESASKDVPDGFMAALEEFSRSDKSHNWVGDNKRGFISNVNSLHDALQKLEEILRKFESAPGAVDVKKQETLAVQAVKPTGQQLPTPAPASGPQKPLPAPMQQQKPKPNGNLNKQARPSPASGQNHGHASGAKNEVIELD